MLKKLENITLYPKRPCSRLPSIFMSGTPTSQEQTDEVIVWEPFTSLLSCWGKWASSLSLEEAGFVSVLSPAALPFLISSLFTEVHESSRVSGNGIKWITGGLGATGIKLWDRLSVRKYWFGKKMNLALNQAHYQWWRNEGRNYLELSNNHEPGTGLALSLPVIWLTSNCTASL